MNTSSTKITVSIAQIAPVWLNKEKTIQKVQEWIKKASSNKADLVVFGEALVPGYPFWVELTHSPEFNSPIQKDLFAYYARQAVCIENGDLDPVCETARKNKIAVYLGIIERPIDRGGHSLYCSLVYINKTGEIRSVHRKLMPTYEERLVWSTGDGNGLRVHPLNGFTLGGLNCWENWMPLTRAALYGLGENIHMAVWPGSDHNTQDITRFIARESRSFVVSASATMKKADMNNSIPHAALIKANCPNVLTNGGSCIAGPDGEWIIAPQINEEKLYIATLDLDTILRERHNFDPSGHYSRPDVLKLEMNNARQTTVHRDS